jgi:hypothetical protein
MSRSLPSLVIGKLRHRKDRRAPRLDAPPPAAGEGLSAAAPPIFVVGCFRSGTSLVRRILDSHSAVACPPESKFLLPLASVLRDETAMRGFRGMGYERADVAAALAAFASGFFAHYAASRGKRRWGDKTPEHVGWLDELRELFGAEARFVLVYRHGMDVAFSLSDPRRDYPVIRAHVERAGGDVPIAAARFWAEQTDLVDRFRRAHPDGCFVLRYEELTTRPEGTLRPMFEFLGERWEPEVLEYHRFEHHRGMEDPDVHRRTRIEPNSGRYRAWPDERQRAVREACEPLLSELGYE